MARSKYFKIRPVTLVQQAYHMRLAYPAFICMVAKNTATWTGTLQPSALSSIYKLQISYKLFDTPEIKVLSPELKLHPDHKKLPHFYHDKGSLCVHSSDDWRPDLFIAYTIMQWISGWLYFYEAWLATGCWLGGGTHPDAPQHKAS